MRNGIMEGRVRSLGTVCLYLHAGLDGPSPSPLVKGLAHRDYLQAAKYDCVTDYFDVIVANPSMWFVMVLY